MAVRWRRLAIDVLIAVLAISGVTLVVIGASPLPESGYRQAGPVTVEGPPGPPARGTTRSSGDKGVSPGTTPRGTRRSRARGDPRPCRHGTRRTGRLLPVTPAAPRRHSRGTPDGRQHGRLHRPAGRGVPEVRLSGAGCLRAAGLPGAAPGHLRRQLRPDAPAVPGQRGGVCDAHRHEAGLT